MVGAISPKLVARPPAPGSGKTILGPVGSAMLISALLTILFQVLTDWDCGGVCYNAIFKLVVEVLPKSRTSIAYQCPVDKVRVFDT